MSTLFKFFNTKVCFLSNYMASKGLIIIISFKQLFLLLMIHIELYDFM